MLTTAVDPVRTVPLSRWDTDDGTAPRFAAMLDDERVARFDSAAFGIAAQEAVLMDPQQRLLLETVLRVVTTPNGPHPQLAALGTYVGIASSEYASLVQSYAQAATTTHATATAISVAAGRIAYVFGASGPCLAVDTACSSSLVALQAAFAEITAGRLLGATVSGVHIQSAATSSQYVLAGGMLSPVGRCQVVIVSTVCRWCAS